MKCIVIKKILPLFIITVICFAAKAQQVPLDVAVQNRFNEITISEDTNIFTGFRAINWLELKPYLKNRGTDIMDSVFGISNDGTSYAFKQMGVDNWMKAATDKHVVTVDPYIILGGGYANQGVG